MKYEERQGFDQARDKVLRMFTDRAYFERKYALSGGWDIQVLQHQLKGRHFQIKCRYHRKPDAPVPAFAQKFIGASVEVTQEDRWDLEAGTGRFTIELKNVPMRIGVDMRMVDEPPGCANLLQWSLVCPIPLIGGKLEQILAEQMQIKAVEDLAISRKLLADY